MPPDNRTGLTEGVVTLQRHGITHTGQWATTENRIFVLESEGGLGLARNVRQGAGESRAHPAFRYSPPGAGEIPAAKVIEQSETPPGRLRNGLGGAIRRRYRVPGSRLR